MNLKLIKHRFSEFIQLFPKEEFNLVMQYLELVLEEYNEDPNVLYEKLTKKSNSDDSMSQQTNFLKILSHQEYLTENSKEEQISFNSRTNDTQKHSTKSSSTRSSLCSSSSSSNLNKSSTQQSNANSNESVMESSFSSTNNNKSSENDITPIIYDDEHIKKEVFEIPNEILSCPKQIQPEPKRFLQLTPTKSQFSTLFSILTNRPALNKSENKLLANDPNESSSKMCMVCERETQTRNNYGLSTCTRCRDFFKRCIKSDYEIECSFDGKCVVEMRDKKKCRKCAYLKCLELGMIPIIKPKYKKQKLDSYQINSTETQSNENDEDLDENEEDGEDAYFGCSDNDGEEDSSYRYNMQTANAYTNYSSCVSYDKCQVCNGEASGFYFGIIACHTCSNLYTKYSSSQYSLSCVRNDNKCCLNSKNESGKYCVKCRFDKFKNLALNYYLSNGAV